MLSSLRTYARPLARIGCIAIGTVYALVGTLALLALSGVLTGFADENRMVLALMKVPGGALMVWGIIAGVGAWVLWRTIEVVANPHDLGRNWPHLLRRLGYALSAMTYGAFLWSLAGSALSPVDTKEASEQARQTVVRQLLGWTAGPWLIALAGAALIAAALVQFVIAVTGKYLTEVDLDGRPRGSRIIMRVVGSYGYAARGVILAVLGQRLIRAGIDHSPGTAADTDTAFDVIGGPGFGDVAFFFVAIGTISYGLFMYATAKYYQFREDD